MAAITFKFGDQSQITPLDSASALITREQLVRVALRRRQGLTGYDERLPEGMVSELANQAVEASHAGLEHMVWLRKVVEDALVGNQITVAYEGREVLLYLAEPLPNVPAWNPPASKNVTKFSLLSWTSKMGTPSFSLPAGATAMGGSCPGANAGQTTTTKAAAESLAPLISKKIGGWPVRLAQAICQRCVTGDTRILVRGKGLVPIETMVGQGDFEVWSGKAWRTTHAITTGVKPTWQVTTNWGFTARVSEDHELIDAQGEKVKVAALEEGDALAWAPGESPFPAEAGTGYRRLVQEHFNQLPDNCPVAWDARVGTFLGMLVADGSVATDANGYRFVLLGKGADQREELALVSSWVQGWTGSTEEVEEISEQTGARLRGLEPAPATQTFLRLHWKTKSLSNFVQHMGIDKSDPSVQRVPPSVWTASHEGVRGFLSGYFGADGSITTTPDGKIEISAASVSRGLLQDVQLLLHAFGIKSTLCAYEKSNEWRAREGYRSLYKLGINAIDDVRRFAERIGFFAKVKHDKLMDRLEKNADRRGTSRRPTVRSAQPTGIEEPVYDLVDVGPELTFSGNGLLHFDCYAEGGQYATGLVQFAQLVRYAWTKEAVSNGTFVDVMDWAVKNANYHLDGKGTVKVEMQDEDGRIVEREIHPPIERDGEKYFRIHDSGDMYDVNYLEAWQAVARRNPKVTFWAPSRMWMLPAYDRVMASNPKNLVVRPSAYHINEPPPRELIGQGSQDGKGWAAGSTSYKDVLKPPGKRPPGEKLAPGELGPSKPYDWDCQAYNTESENVTCREAEAPDGEIGCRACWKMRDTEVNYTLH